MSVFIEDYCKGNTNDFAKRLKELHDEAVIIGSDELEFSNCEFDVIARIYIAHAISCYDIEVMQEVLAGCYWRFMTSFKGRGFELWIDLKNDML